MTASLRVSTVNMSREEWLAARKLGVGSSDAATVSGLNPYQSPFSLWEQKLGRAEAPDLSENEAVHFGNVLENVVAEEFERRTGRRVRRVNAILRHPQHPFMLANLDREIVAEDGGEPEILECKTAGFRATFSEEWGDGIDAVPTRYWIQVQHQLAVRDRRRAFLAVLMGGQSFRIYEIARDDVAIEDLIKLEAAFWRCVETGEAPAIRSISDALRAFPNSRAVTIEASDDIEAAAAEMQRLTAQKRALEASIETLKGVVGSYLGDADTLVDVAGNPILTWKTQSRKAYTVAESSTRVFRFKKSESGIL